MNKVLLALSGLFVFLTCQSVLGGIKPISCAQGYLDSNIQVDRYVYFRLNPSEEGVLKVASDQRPLNTVLIKEINRFKGEEALSVDSLYSRLSRGRRDLFYDHSILSPQQLAAYFLLSFNFDRVTNQGKKAKVISDLNRITEGFQVKEISRGYYTVLRNTRASGRVLFRDVEALKREVLAQVDKNLNKEDNEFINFEDFVLNFMRDITNDKLRIRTLLDAIKTIPELSHVLRYSIQPRMKELGKEVVVMEAYKYKLENLDPVYFSTSVSREDARFYISYIMLKNTKNFTLREIYKGSERLFKDWGMNSFQDFRVWFLASPKKLFSYGRTPESIKAEAKLNSTEVTRLVLSRRIVKAIKKLDHPPEDTAKLVMALVDRLEKYVSQSTRIPSNIKSSSELILSELNQMGPKLEIEYLSLVEKIVPNQTKSKITYLIKRDATRRLRNENLQAGNKVERLMAKEVGGIKSRIIGQIQKNLKDPTQARGTELIVDFINEANFRLREQGVRQSLNQKMFHTFELLLGNSFKLGSQRPKMESLMYLDPSARLHTIEPKISIIEASIHLALNYFSSEYKLSFDRVYQRNERNLVKWGLADPIDFKVWLSRNFHELFPFLEKSKELDKEFYNLDRLYVSKELAPTERTELNQYGIDANMFLLHAMQFQRRIYDYINRKELIPEEVTDSIVLAREFIVTDRLDAQPVFLRLLLQKIEESSYHKINSVFKEKERAALEQQIKSNRKTSSEVIWRRLANHLFILRMNSMQVQWKNITAEIGVQGSKMKEKLRDDLILHPSDPKVMDWIKSRVPDWSVRYFDDLRVATKENDLRKVVFTPGVHKTEKYNYSSLLKVFEMKKLDYDAQPRLGNLSAKDRQQLLDRVSSSVLENYKATGNVFSGKDLSYQSSRNSKPREIKEDNLYAFYDVLRPNAANAVLSSFSKNKDFSERRTELIDRLRSMSEVGVIQPGSINKIIEIELRQHMITKRNFQDWAININGVARDRLEDFFNELN
ncbi:MAG: hypothetical protein AB8E15_13585 [Bdellovibrionales bacterium]